MPIVPRPGHVRPNTPAPVDYVAALSPLQGYMIDSPENPVLTQLRVLRADISTVQGSLGEIKRRLATLEGGQASIIQRLGRWPQWMRNSSLRPMA